MKKAILLTSIWVTLIMLSPSSRANVICGPLSEPGCYCKLQKNLATWFSVPRDFPSQSTTISNVTDCLAFCENFYSPQTANPPCGAQFSIRACFAARDNYLTQSVRTE